MKLNLKTIDHVIVIVENMNRSIEFYRDVLGLPIKFSSDSWTEISTGTTTLALHGGGFKNKSKTNSEPHKDIAGTASISFHVDDINSAYEYLKSKGCIFTLPPTPRPKEGITLAVTQDPDGFEICFAQNHKKK